MFRTNQDLSTQFDKASVQAFKGIALFTPGGDLIYCMDSHKQMRWHGHLCSTLQHLLDLPEPPHFLVPCYTATIDRRIDPLTQQLDQVAEAAPLVLRYQKLLNAVFGTGNVSWQPTPLRQEVCDPVVLATYRTQFPQLWASHDLIVQANQTLPYTHLSSSKTPLTRISSLDTQGYVLRLFVSGHTMVTERTMQRVHNLLEQLLHQPYTLKVIDVAQHPEEAEANQVTATPTLVRVHPSPVRRIVGNLDHLDQLLGVLRLPDE